LPFGIYQSSVAVRLEKGIKNLPCSTLLSYRMGVSAFPQLGYQTNYFENTVADTVTVFQFTCVPLQSGETWSGPG